MTAPIVAVLGGSTPFTAAYVEAVRAAADALPACELRLYGRNSEALQRMASYSRARLSSWSWTVSTHVRLDEAVRGASIVVNQIRFGDLEGRAEDEAVAARFGVPADETLGPCGLLAALRVAPQLRSLGAELGKHCPDAWVLNLSNPLSVATAALLDGGAPPKTIGLCELPAATVQEACVVLGLEQQHVEWKYTGLNHRGFITSLRYKREELLPQLPELLRERTIFGIGATEVRQTGALALKYFQLMTGRGTSPGRAEFLIGLREELSHELEHPDAPPPSLSRRRLDWYEGAIVPLMRAVFSETPHVVVIDSRDEDGLVREHRARVSARGITPLNDEAPASIAPWLDAWSAHERAVLRAVRDPGAAQLREALELDPTVPPSKVTEITRHIAAGGTP
ncbi:MAG: hypothetical protein ACJ790_17840 [Myxococcaceae bacterium]